MLKLLEVEVYLGIILRDVRKTNHVGHNFSKCSWGTGTPAEKNILIFPAKKNILS